MKKIVLIALCLVFAAAGSASADLVSSLGVAGDYNLFTLNSGVTATLYSSDSQGNVAIAGDATLSSYSVARLLTGDNAKFVVGGNLNMTNGQVGENGTGSIYAATATLDGVTPNNYTSQSIVDFAAAAEYLTNASAQWRSLTATGTENVDESGALTLTGTGNSLEVFDLDISVLGSAYSLAFSDVNSDATVLINVTGTTDASLSFDYLSDLDLSQILFNFSDATSLTFGSFYGSILAPNAAVTSSSAQLNGQVIAGSFSGQAQFHNVTFNGDLPTVVPLPGSLLILGGGLLGLVGLRRKKA